MQELHNWNSLNSFFSALNGKVEYVVLRNYEYFLEGKLFNEDHPDIDVLCYDSKYFISVAKSKSRNRNEKDLIHHKIKINNREISLDIRHVGDGYYDKKWEIEMLRTRCLFQGLCYVMDKENYFYSLLYHALIHKYQISSDYQEKLEVLAEDFPLKLPYKHISLDTLQHYMRRKNYFFTYPEYVGGVANFTKVDKSLIELDLLRIASRYLIKIKRKIVGIL